MRIVALVVVAAVVLAIAQKFLFDPLHAKLDRLISLLESAGERPHT